MLNLIPVLYSALVSGTLALIATFVTPSEAKNARIGLYSPARIGLGGVILLSLIVIALILRHERKTGRLSKRLTAWITKGDRPYFLFLSLLGAVFLCLWAFQFSWLFVPKNLRPVLLWGAFTCAFSAGWLRITLRERFAEGHYGKKYRLFPRWGDLSGKQRRHLILPAVLSVIYLGVLLPSNINGSRDWDDFRHYGGDEYVIYPILQAVCDPGENFSQALYHHYIYEDYHYGYPFYAWSSFVMLPLRLIWGNEALEHINLTLPLLRVMVSVIPLMMACLVLTFLFTRFENGAVTSLTYIFLLTAPGSLQNNQGFWHPDGLNLLFVCLGLYFLQRDQLRFGRNFFLCAFCAGLSAATRLYGFFFFLAIGVSLLMGLIKGILRWKQFFLKGLLFVIVMGGTILWADPFLFRSDARGNMARIMAEKTGEMSSGYQGDFNDPKNDYRPGWEAWYPAFEDHYTEMYCFFYLIVSLGIACFVGRERYTAQVTLLWWVVIAVYLIWFVAVKSTQYVLPMMLPLMSAVFLLPRAVTELKRKPITVTAWVITGGVYLSQLIMNLIKIAPRFK